jgi:hypothetical protein
VLSGMWVAMLTRNMLPPFSGNDGSMFLSTRLLVTGSHEVPTAVVISCQMMCENDVSW